MKTKILQLAIILFLGLSFNSCMTTKTQVGTFRETKGNEYTFDKGKQVWLFWGVLPMGRRSVNTPTNGSCEVVTKFRLVDALITGLTGGIVTTYSIKVVAKK